MCTANKESLEKLMQDENIYQVVPIDIKLGIDVLPFKMTREMMCEVAFWAQNQASFKAAAEIIKKTHDISLSASTIRTVAEFIGKIIFEQDTAEANLAFERREDIKCENKKTGILYVQMDGATLNTRLKNNDGSSWRENKLGMCFSSDNISVRINKKGEEIGQIQKKEYTSYVGSVSEFKKYLFACAKRNGYGQYETTVIISDGAQWIHNMCKELFPDATHILDLFHLCENTYSFAKAIFKGDEAKYVPWAEDMVKKFKNSETNEVIEELKKYKKRKLPKNTVNLYNYVSNNIDRIDYKHYKSLGYYVGSGAIESGNKVVMQKRLKLAGMRWDEIYAQYLLTLRTKFESGLWKTVVSTVLSCNFPVALRKSRKRKNPGK